MAKIEKIGIYLPEKVVTNEDLKKEFPDADFQKFEDTVGVKSRRVATSGQTALDLAEKAAKDVIEQSDNAEIDFILFVPNHLIITFLEMRGCFRIGLASPKVLEP